MPDLGHDKENALARGQGLHPEGRTVPAASDDSAAVAAGVGLTSVTAWSSSGSQADAGEQAARRCRWASPAATTVEFRGRVAPVRSTGELHQLRLPHPGEPRGSEHLFSGTALSETTALLTAYATGDLRARTTDEWCMPSTSWAR